jgi:hypothetical protein
MLKNKLMKFNKSLDRGKKGTGISKKHKRSKESNIKTILKNKIK